MLIEPIGLPTGKMHFWNLSNNNEDNHEDLGVFDMPNGLSVDLGYYGENYCVKAVVNQDYSENEHPCWLEIKLDRILPLGDYTCQDPYVAVKQFVDIANYFSKVKIKIG